MAGVSLPKMSSINWRFMSRTFFASLTMKPEMQSNALGTKCQKDDNEASLADIPPAMRR